MVAKVKVLPYQCEVCSKTYATEKQAEKCEQSHEETKQKKLKEQADRMKLHDRLVEIKNTAESWQELQENALVELKAHYGDDFVLSLPHNYTGWYGYNSGAKCTYVTSKPVKKSDYFNRWGSAREVDSSLILKTLGFTTHSGNGDGTIYSYQVSFNNADFPAIKSAMEIRNEAVIDCEHEIILIANATMVRMYDDSTFKEYQNKKKEIECKIEELRDELYKLNCDKNVYVNNAYMDDYTKECSELIDRLPQAFKSEYPDPDPSEFFQNY